MCQGVDEFALLLWYKAAVVGQWQGTASTPWTPDYPVTFRFDADGHYTSSSSSAEWSALYYDMNGDSPLKMYELEDILANKSAVGTIQLVSYPGDGGFQADIKKVHLSAGLTELSFEVWNDKYGPMRYQLERVSGPLERSGAQGSEPAPGLRFEPLGPAVRARRGGGRVDRTKIQKKC
ncbi:MAG: hypothetical protein EOO74_05745 [Myxococcales bacterium]|nr:MAG: hypothetical protein EOO74_05745 [Myxococcales bacterium]